MIATYNGKVIVYSPSSAASPWTVSKSQDTVDQIIANDTRWSEIIASGYGGPTVDMLVYDNGEPITEWIDYTEVPGDADSSIVLEPAFYFKQNG